LIFLSKDKIKILYETVLNINNSEELKNLYLAEIILMNPNPEYQILANNTISYLTLFLENIVASYDIGYELSSEEYIFIENEIWVYK
jgi:hypothetical protein